jgi:hypothetical protein
MQRRGNVGNCNQEQAAELGSCVSTGGAGDASPLEFGEEGTSMSPRFHSRIVVDIPLQRYRAIKYSATFDDNRPIFELYMQFKIIHGIS